MNYCPNCGRPIRWAGDYCSYCNETRPTQATGEPAVCPQCRGTGTLPCKTCHGTGRIEHFSSNPVTGEKIPFPTICPDCRNGKIKCNYLGCRDGRIWK